MKPSSEQIANARERSAEIGRQRAQTRQQAAAFDFNRAIKGLHRIFAELDANDRRK